MTDYKCGHSSDVIIMGSNALSIIAWLEWKNSVGWGGDKSMCWECWCKKEGKK